MGPNGVSGWAWRDGASRSIRELNGRAGLAAVLEDSQLICSVMVAVGSMIMIGLRLYNDLQ